MRENFAAQLSRLSFNHTAAIDSFLQKNNAAHVALLYEAGGLPYPIHITQQPLGDGLPRHPSASTGTTTATTTITAAISATTTTAAAAVVPPRPSRTLSYLCPPEPAPTLSVLSTAADVDAIHADVAYATSFFFSKK
jgi:hypothetical protein